jgi:hypothetical protein
MSTERDSGNAGTYDKERRGKSDSPDVDVRRRLHWSECFHGPRPHGIHHMLWLLSQIHLRWLHYFGCWLASLCGVCKKRADDRKIKLLLNLRLSGMDISNSSVGNS